ncbi:MAG: phosphate ABC transporter ATP-binding protein, partial [Cyanobacteria bacterium P01_A01_bin.17]
GDYTVVVVTHNLAQARRIANQVALFWVHEGVGQVIESGPTQQVFAEPQHSLTKAYVSGRRG